ncbi:MAG: hypothetical protein HYV17_11105 [Xanthomonadales bacterium]|nr:hypothetical protein [Xanthomonadales bacterium]
MKNDAGMNGLGPWTRRGCAVLLGLAWLVLGTTATAANGGLALGFVDHDGAIDRIAMTALAQAPNPAIRAQARWSVQADDASGRMLWRWPVAAVQQFHRPPGAHGEFVLQVPAIAPGTLLSLRDSRERLLWSERFDAATLAAAQERRSELEALVAATRRTTAALGARAPKAALSRQLAGLDRQRFVEAKGEAKAGTEAGSQPTEVALPSSRLGALAEFAAPRASDSVDPELAASVGGAAITGTVPVRVVDEHGLAPAAPVHAHVSVGDDYLGRVDFDAQGQALLPLVAGGHYAISFFPQAPLVAQRFEFVYSGEPLPPFVLEIGWQLDIELRGANGLPLEGSHEGTIWGSNGSASRVFPSSDTTVPGLLRFALPKDAQWHHTLGADPAGDAYIEISYSIGALDGPRSLTLHLLAATQLPGRIVAADGGDLPGAGAIYCFSAAVVGGLSYSGSANFGSDGLFGLYLPLGLSSYCYVAAPTPLLSATFTRTFAAGDQVGVVLLRGVPVRFHLQDEQGVPIAASLDGRWDDAPSGTSASCYANPCELLAPADRAVRVRFRFYSGDYQAMDLPLQQYLANSEHVLTARALRSVSGSVVNADPIEEGYLRVRVYDADNRFVVSSTGLDFSFRLPGGRYRFEADPNVPHSLQTTQWLYRPVASSDWVQVRADTELPPLQLATERGALELLVEHPCAFENRAVRVVYTAPDGRRLDRLRYQHGELPDLPRPPGQCASVHTFGLPPGHHTLDVAPLGWPLQRLDLRIAAGQTQQRVLVFEAAGRTAVWRGRVLDAQQQPQPMVGILLDDADQSTLTMVGVDAQGRFELPFAPGWGAKVFVPGGDQAPLGATLRFGASTPGPVWQLDRLALTSTVDAGLIRVYGDGDRRKRNLVFIAEGYTQVAETYTDRNGNGRWDGILWYDLNQSGVLEWNSDRIGFYGEVTVPTEGTVPTLQNEPFVDRNGDGVLSIDDPGLFSANVRAFLRSLLSSDVWSEHRDHFNAWVMFAPSAQAGHDVRAANGEVLLARDTRYGATLDLNGSILQVDTTTMLQEALTALPEADLMVAMLNEPIPGGRANASTGDPGFIVFAGGVLNNDGNGTVQSHEMGHFVGALCDEYAFFGGFHPFTGSLNEDVQCANSTVRVDPALIPWRDLLPEADAAVPTLHRDGSLGVYEGSSYFQNGAYRPSMDSTMRFNRPFFNTPSRLALEAAIQHHAIAADTLFESGFE